MNDEAAAAAVGQVKKKMGGSETAAAADRTWQHKKTPEGQRRADRCNGPPQKTGRRFFFWGHFSQSGFVNFDMFTEFAYHTRQIYLYKAKPELK